MMATGVQLGLGCAPIANLFTDVTEDDAHLTIGAALDSGIRFFDTAPHYGAGLSESRVGAALRGVPRENFTLATKVGRLIVDASGEPVRVGGSGHATVADLSYDGVQRSLEGSLKRLGVDRVDLLYLHDPDPDDVDVALHGAFAALLDLRQQGVVSEIGVAMNHCEPLARFSAESDPDVVMVAGRLSLLEPSAISGLLPVARRNNVDVVAAGVFQSGILADPRPGARCNYQPASEAVLARAQDLDDICRRYGADVAAAALQYPARFAGVTRVVAGLRSESEVAAAVRRWNTRLPDALWRELAAAGVVMESEEER